MRFSWGAVGEALALQASGPESGLQKPWVRSGVMAYACSPSTRETKTALVHLGKSSLLCVVSSRLVRDPASKTDSKQTNKKHTRVRIQERICGIFLWVFRKLPRLGLCQGCPWMEFQRGHCVKLRQWWLNFVGEPKRLEMPELWNTCQAEPQSRCGTSPRKKCVVVNKGERSWRSEDAVTSDLET